MSDAFIEVSLAWDAAVAAFKIGLVLGGMGGAMLAILLLRR